MSEWTCARCTFANPPLALACNICTAIKSEEGAQDTTKQNGHAALTQTQTRVAPPTHSSYIVRSESQTANYNDAAKGEWACNSCSLLNAAHMGRCAVCDSVRPPRIGSGVGGAGNSAQSASFNPAYMPAAALPRSVLSSVAAAASSSVAAATATAAAAAASGAGAAAPRRSASAAPLAPGQWVCQSCTFVNSQGEGEGREGRVCEVCATPAERHRQAGAGMPSAAVAPASPSAAAAGSSPSGAWLCSVCSLLNLADAPRCVVCQHINPRVTPHLSTPAYTTPQAMPPARAARGKIVVSSRANSNGSSSYAAPAAAGSAASFPSFAAAAAGSSASFPSFAAAAAAPSSSVSDPSGEESAAAQWREIVSICSSIGSNFVDDSFRAGDRSIMGTGPAALELSTRRIPLLDAAGNVIGSKPWGPFAWRRAGAHGGMAKNSSAPWCLLPFNADGSVNIKPQDIRQGELGDCWFLSALSVLAERPALLSHLLITQELNDVGAYQVRFCKGGKWVVVTVDDFLPVDPETNRLAFSHSPNNELWVAILEKAYAKLHLSYSAIESGSICDAFVDLTGAPAERIDLHVDEMSKFAAQRWARNCGGDPAQARQILWATILSFRQSRFLMGASCGRRGVAAEEYKRVGLRSDHAYALLDARFESGIQFLKLRNPWGTHSWTGAWSASSPMWTPALRRALNYPAPTASAAALLSRSPVAGHQSLSDQSGCFWMSLDDFLLYFRTIDVCKYQDDWHVVRLEDSVPLAGWAPSGQALLPAHVGWSSDCMYELAVPHSTCVFISMIQRDLRGSDAPKPHTYRNLGMFLLKSRDASCTPESSLASYQRCAEVFPESQRMSTCEALLTETNGRYLLMPCSYAPTLANGEGVVADSSSSSSSAAAASSSPKSSSASSFPFVLCIYSAHPILVKRRPQYLPALTWGLGLGVVLAGESKPLGSDGHASLYTFECQGGLWFVVVNRHPSKFLSIAVDCAESTGLQSSRRSAHPAASPFKTQDLVPPRHRQLLLALLTSRSELGYSYSRSCTFMHVEGRSMQQQPHNPPLKRGFDIHQPVCIDDGRVELIQ